jgi:hypothetical protein
MIAHFQRFVKDYFIDLATIGVYDCTLYSGAMAAIQVSADLLRSEHFPL